MKLKITKAAAALTLAAAALVASPLAANATTYPEDTPGPGAVVPLTTPAGIFAGNEPVSILLSGEDANFATVGIVKAAYVENAPIGTVTSEPNGSVAFSLVLPDTATGTYSTLLTSPSRPQGYTVVVSADGSVISGGGTGTGTGSTGAGGSGLPATGMDSASLLGLWVGGGALVLAGGAVAVGAAVHRQRKHADA
jgi:hypothetical protein